MMTVPAGEADELDLLQTLMGSLASTDPTQLSEAEVARRLRIMEQVDAIGAAVRGGLLAAFSAQDGCVADGQRSTRTWLVHCTRVIKGQAGEHRAVEKVARDHPALHAALAEGWVVTKSEALQLARWTRAIPEEYRHEAEGILVAAARAGADLRALASICADIRYRTVSPDPNDEQDKHLDRGLSFDTTFEGAGVLHADLTPECAMVQAVLDALSTPAGGGDLRTRPQRYHDALAEAMRRLLASGLLPKRAGQPVKALVHIYFAELREMDPGSALQDKWIAEYRARWAAHRAAASVATGDGGAWPEGEAARAIACDALIVPVVTGDIEVGAVEDLILLCVRYHRLRTQGGPGNPDDTGAPDRTGSMPRSDTQDAAHGNGTAIIPAGLIGATARQARQAAVVADILAELEHQILGKILQVLSGPSGVASFLRRHLLGKGLNGPSLPLDVGRTDDIPLHLRRLVSLRDQTCQYPGGCDQPAAGCEPHHVQHLADGGRTSLTNLKDYCWWHHHVVLHQLGWTLAVHPDGTSQVTSPTGKIIRSHSPPPRPG